MVVLSVCLSAWDLYPTGRKRLLQFEGMLENLQFPRHVHHPGHDRIAAEMLDKHEVRKATHPHLSVY